jgi:hypothetical protein
MAQTASQSLASALSGLSFRNNLNTILAALFSGNSGPSAPSPTVGGMLWLDTGVSPPVMRVRNNANTGWLVVSPEQVPANSFWGNPTGSAAELQSMTAAQVRAMLAPGQAVISGSASDINASNYALLGSTPNFVATSGIVMAAVDLVASKTTQANIIQVLGRLWNVTAGAAHGTTVDGIHGQGPTAGSVTAAYSAHTSGLLGGLTIGNTYRLDVMALKQVAEGPLSVIQYRGSVFNI